MSVEWAGLSPELLLTLDRGRAEPLRSQLEGALREAIRTGRLRVGERLPSTRALGDPRGSPVLREVLAVYLRRVRGAAADAERMVVCAGFAQGLNLVLRTLARAGVRRVAFENPGYADTGTAATAAWEGVEAVPVAARAGISRVEYLRRALAAEADRVASGTRPPLTRDDWRQLHALTADLADEDVMRGAWS